ncbi:MAG TPA: FecR domain-containing protein [Parapedobacter sp.]|nr:FecR domain-containing protein [Parapedobacter sp.]
MISKKQFLRLIERHRRGLASPQEENLLQRYYDLYESEPDVLDTLSEREKANIYARLEAQLFPPASTPLPAKTILEKPSIPGRRWLPYAAAAVLAFASVSMWVFFDDVFGPKPKTETLTSTDIGPGGNRATLTLADGRTIDLSEAQPGIVVGDEIRYTDGSNVLDGKTEVPKSDVLRLLSLTTPKGGTYQITLPDGTNVWLNAASTLKYPSQFSDDERVVELTGEAYFDVAKTKQQNSKNAQKQAWPFRVVSKGQRVEVLGTEFNISAYTDDPETKTTLVNGKVKVIVNGEDISNPLSNVSYLNPGQQSILRGETIDVNAVDTEPYTAWKDGLIVFNGAEIMTIVRQLERWYDVTFHVSDWPSGLRLEGELPRNTKLSGVLEALKLNTGKQLYIEGRRVMERR